MEEEKSEKNEFILKLENLKLIAPKKYIELIDSLI
jgi:hypothetical protein